MISHDGWRFYKDGERWNLANPEGGVILWIDEHGVTSRENTWTIPLHVWAMVAPQVLVTPVQRPGSIEEEDAFFSRAFREELERVAQVLGMPGSPDLTRDVAPRVKALDDLVRELRHNAETWMNQAKRLQAALKNREDELSSAQLRITGLLDEGRSSTFQLSLLARQALIRWVVDWLLSRNGSQLLDALKAREYRALLAELDEILKHGGKPPNWVA